MQTPPDPGTPGTPGTPAHPGAPDALKPRPIVHKGVMLAFPTPIAVHQFPDTDALNAHVKQFVLDWRQREPGQQRSNRGGWHSPDKLLPELGEPYANQLAQMFLGLVRHTFGTLIEGEPQIPQARVEAWANVNDRGDVNEPHIHPGCPWSGVYYVDAEPDKGGRLYFTDPRPAALMTHHALSPWQISNTPKIEPRPGVMVVFPSFLYHAVEAHDSDRPRISLAFNLR
ncbi:MAG: TIGR02466 family protein [Planctomycetota bacterium]